MPMSPADRQQYDATAWRKAITMVKAYQMMTFDASGVACKVYVDPADPGATAKVIGIKRGIARVVEAGFAFPDGIDFYLSNVANYQNIAFHRDLSAGNGTHRKAVVMLSNTAVDPIGKASLRGVANQVGSQSGEAFCEAIVVHELGHNLHERLSPDFFWSDQANEIPNVDLACQVSVYAATNKKEVVAEVFTGLLYAKAYSRAILNMYEDYEGFVIPNPPRGGGRGRSNAL